MFHSKVTLGDIHIPHQWEYADATARGAASGFISTDVGKLARQLDNNSLWILTNYSPIAWQLVGSGAAPGAHASTHQNGGGDVVAHQNLSGAGTNTHANIDTHIASTSNPHVVNQTQVGLSNVTNDSQLKRAAADFAAFTEKTTPANTDILLVEDSAASGAKKKVQIGNFPGTTMTDTAPVNVTKATASAGVAAQASRQDHKHDISTGTPGSNAIGNAAAEGTAASLARSDHQHGVSGGSPVSVGTALADGSATTYARSDHVHTGLTRDAGDIATFTEKTIVADADLLIIEDSAASNSKKKLQVQNLIQLFQTLEAHVTVDITTNSRSWVDLLTQSVTTGARKLLVRYAACSDNTNNAKMNYFRITIDGTGYGACGALVNANQPASAVGQALVSVGAGAHTVKLQWYSNANTARIRPVTNPDSDNASLLVQEVK